MCLDERLAADALAALRFSGRGIAFANLAIPETHTPLKPLAVHVRVRPKSHCAGSNAQRPEASKIAESLVVPLTTASERGPRYFCR